MEFRYYRYIASYNIKKYKVILVDQSSINE